jgi:hypothetical protein
LGPRTGLDGCGKSCLRRDSIPGPRVAILTEYSQPTKNCYIQTVSQIIFTSILWDILILNLDCNRYLSLTRPTSRWVHSFYLCTSYRFSHTLLQFGSGQVLLSKYRFYWLRQLQILPPPPLKYPAQIGRT